MVLLEENVLLSSDMETIKTENSSHAQYSACSCASHMQKAGKGQSP